MYSPTELIDINHEFENVLNFVQSSWHTIDCLPEMFSVAWQAGLKHGHDQFKLSIKTMDFIHDTLEEKSMNKDVQNYYINLIMGQHRIQNLVLGKFDFEDTTHALFKKITSQYPDWKKIQPHGWDKMLKKYEEFGGMREYDLQKDRNNFQGVKSEMYDFPRRIALPYVMYDEKEQGRHRVQVLLSAVFAQASYVLEYNNSHELAQEIERVHPLLATEPFVLKDLTQNRFIRAMNTARDDDNLIMQILNQGLQKSSHRP